jgi:hypothetical protein
MSINTFWMAAVLGTALLPAGAQAQQVHRCVVDGRTVLSDRPCAGEHKLGSYGPAAPRYAPPPAYASASLPPAPEHLPYLGAECAQLNDAVRTAPARGLRGQALYELHADYRRRCSEDENLALQALWRDRNQQRDARQQQRLAEQAQRQNARVAQEQCQEMQRILQTRRQRDSAAGESERAELQRFEGNYRARCLAN